MTLEEAEKILGPETCAALRARLGPPKPLSDEQIRLLVNLLGDAPRRDENAA